MIRTLLAVVLAAAMPLSAMAALYKWTDANGVVQYSATPPPTGVEFETIRGAPPPSQDPDEAMEELRNKLKAAESEGGAEPTREELFAKNCELAKQNLETLLSDSPVVVSNPDGSKTPLDDDARAAQTEQAQKDVEYFCADQQEQ